MSGLRQVAVAGIGTTSLLKRGTAQESSQTLILKAVLAACDDAGIDAHDVDGFVSYANDLNEGLAIGAALGVHEIRVSQLVWGGGGGGVAAAVNAAATAVASGEAECVVVYRGVTEADDGRGSYGKGHFWPLQTAYGVFTPVQICALRTQRLLEHDGVPTSAMKALSLVCYENAQRNPLAVAYGRPLEPATYEDARSISEPLRLFDCSRENDGASAVVVTTAERARDCRQVPVHVLGGVQGAGPRWSESLENDDAYTSAGFHPAMVRRLWERSGVDVQDVDVTQVYENFTGPAVASLIDVGLCPSGAAAGDVMTLENLRPTGGLPVNTAGGNLADGFLHGIGLVLEAVRQVRGTSTNQVAGAEVSLLLGGPMAPLVSATVFGAARA